MAYEIYQGDCLEVLRTLPDESIHCCVTSPPYWGLRDYGVEGQLGLESTPEEYIENMVKVFREVKRVLRKDGTLWLNLGDSYAGSGRGPTGRNGIGNQEKRQGFHSPKVVIPTGLKPKDLVGIPWRVAFALQADGWYLRQDIIWHKPNAMPESVKDRCTKAHEYIFLLTKNSKYYFNSDLIREPNQDKYDGKRGSTKTRTKFQSAMRTMSDKEEMKKYSTQGRNKRTVWNIPTKPFKEAHFAVFPPALIEPCILAGCPAGGVVLDPFMGSGTTGMVAAMHQRNFIGFELNPEYCKMAEKRIEPYLKQQTIFKLSR